MSTWDIHSCSEVTDEDIEIALEPQRSPATPTPKERAVALLGKMAEVARPGDGAAKILVVLSRIAASGWIDGVLEVRVRPDPLANGVVIDARVDDGQNVSRLVRMLRVAAPFEEFDASVSLSAKRLLPLVPTPSTDGSLRLLARASSAGGPSSRRLIVAAPVAQTVRRSVPLPRDARRPDAPPPPLDGEVDDGWD